ncbi:MAG: hypothetical protein EAS52_21450 [Parapedobacter sp.]|nr:MAG: hypothetical protein EAS52_21450 [Parapedobacter sp.]
MTLFIISLNQLVEASSGTLKAKQRIVFQQINVNKILIQWYQKAKNRIRKYLANVRDKSILFNAIEEIKKSPEKNERSKNDKRVSIEAIQKVMEMRFDQILVNGYEVLQPDDKSIEFEDIRINITPDLVFRYHEDGLIKLGAIKFHISKTKPFDLQQSKMISNLLKQYLEQKVIKKGEVVDERLCWAYDVFAERLLHADKVMDITKDEVQKLCLELKEIYKAL